MGIGVQCETGIGVAQNAGQRFGIHSAGKGVGGEGVTQIVEACGRCADVSDNCA